MGNSHNRNYKQGFNQTVRSGDESFTSSSHSIFTDSSGDNSDCDYDKSLTTYGVIMLCYHLIIERFDKKKHPRRLFLQGKCDDIVRKLVNDVGWKDELKKLCPQYFKVENKKVELKKKTTTATRQFSKKKSK